jgi:hypothetical protein
MDLPNLFNSSPDESKLCLSLYLTDRQVQAGLWQLTEASLPAGRQVAMVAHSEVHNFSNDDDCIKATDESLQELGKESEGIEEVVFGFDPSWIDQGNITDLKKPLLKRLTKELSLRPVGFVVTTEALTQFLSIKEPLFSALVIEITGDEIIVMVVERGNLVTVEQVGKSGDLAADLTEAMARFEPNLQQKHLPPKMLLISVDEDEDELKDKQQALVGFDWTKDHPFLHQPVVEIEPMATMIEAVTSQGGKAVAQAQGFKVAQVKTKETVPEFTETAAETSQLNPAEMGFAAVDVDKTASAFQSDNLITPAEETTGEFTEEPNQFEDEFKAVETDQPVSSFGVPMTAVEPAGSPVEKLPKSGFKFPNLFKKKTAVPEFSPLEYVAPLAKKKHSHLTFIGLGLVGGLLILFGLSWFWINKTVTAQVDINLKNQNVSQEVTLTIDPQANTPNAEKLVLPGQLVNQEASGSKSIDTTGVKLIGDRAKGKVTLINKTDSEKSFDKGTLLSSGKLKFALDENVKVASSSVQTTSSGENKTYGKATVTVTASQIGADSNLEKGKDFVVASYGTNTYSAVNDEAFSGGSSREVRAVAKADLAKLKQELTNELQKQAMKDLSSSGQNGAHFAETGKVTAVKTDYSAKEGDEVNTISLDLTLNVEAVAYQNNDLKPLSLAVLSSQVPSGYQLSQKDPQILSTPESSSSQSAQVKLKAQLTAQAEPKINLEDWKQELAGQKLSSALAILKGKKEVNDANVKIAPSSLSWFVNKLPKDKNKIELTIK